MDMPSHLESPDGTPGRAATVAAIVNGLLVLLAPFALIAILAAMPHTGNGTTVTARVSSTPEYVARILVSIGTIIVSTAPFALVAGWRTFVHAVRREEGRGTGWQGVAEGGGLGLAVALIVLLPGIVTHPSQAPPFVMAYGGMAAVLGLLVGLALRFSALAVLRMAGSRR
jgi:hypothetical protein